MVNSHLFESNALVGVDPASAFLRAEFGEEKKEIAGCF